MVYKGKRSVFVGQPPRIKRCWEAPRRKSRTRDSMLLNITLTLGPVTTANFFPSRTLQEPPHVHTLTINDIDWQTDRITTCISFVNFRKKEILHLFQNKNLLLIAKIYLCVSLGVAIFLTHKRPVLSPWSSLFLCSVSSTGLFPVIIC